jgi:Gpi18-like mannosyltransferase
MAALGAAEEENLLANGSFETLDASGLPAQWFTQAYINDPGYTDYRVLGGARDGQNAALVENFGANDARFAQIVSVEPNTVYKLSGFVHTEDIPDAGMGANLSVADVYVFSDSVYGTQAGWQELTLYGRTGPDQNTVTVFARLGGYSGESEGKAYFDDIRLTKVTGAVPSGVFVADWYKSETPQADTSNDEYEGESRPYWPQLILLSLCFLVLTAFLIPYLQKERLPVKLTRELEGKETQITALLLLAAFALRLILAVKVPGHEVDIDCFTGWGNMMLEGGPAKFYVSGGFADYPPGYLYVLWLNSAIANNLGPISQGMQMLNLKFVPILCDLLAALVLYGVGKKKLPLKAAAAMAVLYAFNPAVVINGAAWGQVDSVLALGLLLVAVFAMERRWDKALPVYMLCVLIKPQALMLGPLGLTALLLELFRKDEKQPWKQLGFGLLWSFAVAAVIVIPFSLKQEGSWFFQKFDWLIQLYKGTLSSYPHPTVNTTNLYYLVGQNWGSLDTAANRAIPLGMALITGALTFWQFATAAKRQGNLFTKYGHLVFQALAFAVFIVFAALDVNYGTLGTALMALVILWVVLTYLRGNHISNLPLMGGILFIGLYVLGIKMHERYLFPALLLLSLAYLQKRDWRILLLLAGFSVTTFINVGIILDNTIRLGRELGHLNPDTQGLGVILSILNLMLCFFAFYTGEVLCAGSQTERHMARLFGKADKAVGEIRRKTALISPRDARLHLTRLDVILMIGVTLAYTMLAFWNLGSMKAPQTAWVSSKAGEQVVLDLGADKNFQMLYYGGINHNDFSVAVSADGAAWSEEYPARMQEGNCFQWQYLVLANQADDSVNYTSTPRDLAGRYVRVTAATIGLNLNEILLRTKDMQVLPVTVSARIGNNPRSELNAPPENLLDEQDTLEGEPGWYTGTYFDEIYHARTAYEHAHNIPPYETSHPPLGKVMMSWAVMAFGMTPFGWRFAGTLAGVLMLPVMYLLSKQLTRRTDLAAAAMLFLTFDLMHFTQTRIATIDSFAVLFIMVSYLCMFRYLLMDFWGTPFWKTLIPLALSGLFMGLGIADKWIGIYSGAGLAILFFWSCWRHLMEAREAPRMLGHKKAAPEDRREVIEQAAKEGTSRILITCLCCLIFFIAVPAVIYYLSYIPYFAPSGGVTVQKIIEAQKGMWSYHSTPGLGADHPFQSPWWEWPLILKPMWYFKGDYVPDGTGSTIYAMGNPAVWWMGFAALLIVLAVFVKRHAWHTAGEGLMHAHTRERDIVPAMLLIGFASQYMPWVLVPRSTFIYHYFASVPFIILCTVVCFAWLKDKWKKVYVPLLWTLVAVSAILFIAFYPYASGVVTPTAWLDVMKWFPKIYY